MECYDSFSFTKQTATLLRGLGIRELIPEFKKRNISTDVLHELSTEELIILGVDPQKAEELKNTLNVKKRKFRITQTNVQDRLQHFLEIIKHGEQQLSLIQAFVAYCRLRLAKERINIFIDPDKCLSASEVLPVSVSATLAEVKEAQKNLSQLQELILRQSDVKSKRDNTRRICVLISGLGLVTLVLMKIYLT